METSCVFLDSLVNFILFIKIFKFTSAFDRPALSSGRRASVPAGPVNFSTSAQLVAPAVVVKGTLSITNCELYFEVDEDEPSFRAIDPKVGRGTGLH